MKSSFTIQATQVANEFIDHYMAAANGEYVKVYLYLLRHQDRAVTEIEIADALNDTESDIRRAIAYWERLGVLLSRRKEETDAADRPDTKSASSEERREGGLGAAGSGIPGKNTLPAAAETPEKRADPGISGAAAETGTRAVKKAAETAKTGGSGTAGESEGSSVSSAVAASRIPAERPFYTPEQVKKLSDEEEEFTQLLYIAQKYLNKVFTPRECEVFAYLYDGLRIPGELLEYLVEYCVQGGHTSIRYLETVGINWHERGIHTVEMAKQYTSSCSSEGFAVMRAFGLSDRRPGDSEMEMIRRWFKEWGFTKELVLEACSRTLKATNKPSFAYADKILMEWKKAKVRTMEDLQRLDAQRAASGGDGGQQGSSPNGFAGRQPAGQGQNSAGAGRTAVPGGKGGSRNRFHNYEQRDTNYDALALKQLKERLGGQQTADGGK